MKEKVYEYDAVICAAEQKGGAYIAFPYDVREEFHAGRVRVHAEFDGEPYDGAAMRLEATAKPLSLSTLITIKSIVAPTMF